MTRHIISDLAQNPQRGVGKYLVVSQVAIQLTLAIIPFNVHGGSVSNQQPKWYQSSNLTPEERRTYQQHTQQLSAAASILAQDNSAHAAAETARSAAAGALNNELSSWVNQFGTARVQLNLDDKFQLSGSQGDMLLPLAENSSTLLFSQFGLRHLDQRTTGNLGFGVRTLARDWMLGVNTFIDNDFSGNNRRLGVGVEAWRDYFRLSANIYHRLSDWHQSRDSADYDERPANGWDLRAQGWLPAVPQLGAKLMLEQYRGDEIALFGKDNRQRNPWALGGGVSYTPVPLITLSAEHRAGSQSQQDSQFSLALNYRPGEPWRKQIDPSAVGASRLLSASLHDLVERNNRIVLNYRRQQWLTLALAENFRGKSLSQLPVKFVVNNTHPLRSINWSSPALSAAGGLITPDGDGRITLTLPAWQAAGSNRYTLTGTVDDMQGNRAVASSTIEVEKADDSNENINDGTVTGDKASALANNADAITFSATVKDAQGNLVSGVTVHWATDHGALSASSSTSGADGVATIRLTSGVAGVAQVSAQINQQAAINAPRVTFTADPSTARVIALVSDKQKITGTGVETTRLTATVADAYNNPVSGYQLNWNATSGSLSAATSQTNDRGLATIELRAPLLNASANGTATVTAQAAAGSQQQTVEIRAVLAAGGKYYWTLLSDYQTTSESVAASYCASFGGGVLSTREDVKNFGFGKADFATMRVNSEFVDGWYRLGAEWTTASGDFSSAGAVPANFGTTRDQAGYAAIYVCNKTQ